jgi:hypothetical protein
MVGAVGYISDVSVTPWIICSDNIAARQSLALVAEFLDSFGLATAKACLLAESGLVRNSTQ